jgi:dihydroneopterin aldolase
MLLTIGIKDAEFFSFHGYYEEERKMGNHFIINSQIQIELEKIIDSSIQYTINYEIIYNICKAEMESTQFLLETVANNILEKYKSTFTNIKSAYVKINKLQPQLGGKLHSSFVELSI